MEELIEHKHCLNCGISIPKDKRFCTKKCEEEWIVRLRKKRYMLYLEFFFLAILLILFVLYYGK